MRDNTSNNNKHGNAAPKEMDADAIIKRAKVHFTVENIYDRLGIRTSDEAMQAVHWWL